MSARQTSPFFSNIKSWEFLTKLIKNGRKNFYCHRHGTTMATEVV